MDLKQVVFDFARATQSFSDNDLERLWEWGDYDEGVRFAFFRTYEDLRQLAAHLISLRIKAGQPLTSAQLCLAQYLAAFRDLGAVLLGVDDALAEKIPAENVWPIRQVVPHILGAERSFYAVTRYAVERFQAPGDRPIEMPDEDFELFRASDDFKNLAQNSPLSALMDFYENWHLRVVQEFIPVSEEALKAPSVFWESQPMPVEFRLHRFDSHLRQHTIQIEKTLELIDHHPNEAVRLLRLIYASLAQVEGALLGANEIGKAERDQVADTIHTRLQEILKG